MFNLSHRSELFNYITEIKLTKNSTYLHILFHVNNNKKDKNKNKDATERAELLCSDVMKH
jgi:hypothetical protein